MVSGVSPALWAPISLNLSFIFILKFSKIDAHSFNLAFKFKDSLTNKFDVHKL
jgi:hypothetical protein